MTPAAQEYLRFLGWTLVVAVALAAVGYLPTRGLAGGAGVRGMLAGCAVSVVASAAGGIPVALYRRGLPALVGSMAVRLLVTVVLALALLLTGAFQRGALLVWVAISYLALLTSDTRYALAARGS